MVFVTWTCADGDGISSLAFFHGVLLDLYRSRDLGPDGAGLGGLGGSYSPSLRQCSCPVLNSQALRFLPSHIPTSPKLRSHLLPLDPTAILQKPSFDQFVLVEKPFEVSSLPLG